MKTEPNDPIHPSADEIVHEGQSTQMYGTNGLTKREYFAAQALSGLMAGAEEYSVLAVAATAAQYADALIEELNK